MRRQKCFAEENMKIKNKHDKDKYVYTCYEKSASNMVFIISAAGETYPDPYYYMERDEAQLSFNEKIYNTGVYVLEYVMEGKGYIESEGKRYEVKAGDFYLLTPTAPHCYYSDKEDPFHKLFINIEGSFVAGLANGLRINNPVHIMHRDISADMEYIQRTLYRTDISDSEKLDLVAVKVCSILLLLKPQPKNSNSRNELAWGIRQYINENISGNITLESICEYFYISKSNLISMFQREFGYTPHKYIMDKRIEAAKKLLKNESLTVAEVAKRVGFEGEKYFYSAFKNVTMETPGQYRRKAQRASANNSKKSRS